MWRFSAAYVLLILSTPRLTPWLTMPFHSLFPLQSSPFAQYLSVMQNMSTTPSGYTSSLEPRPFRISAHPLNIRANATAVTRPIWRINVDLVSLMKCLDQYVSVSLAPQLLDRRRCGRRLQVDRLLCREYAKDHVLRTLLFDLRKVDATASANPSCKWPSVAQLRLVPGKQHID